MSNLWMDIMPLLLSSACSWQMAHDSRKNVNNNHHKAQLVIQILLVIYFYTSRREPNDLRPTSTRSTSTLANNVLWKMAKVKVANKNKITLSLNKIICVKFKVGEFHDSKIFYESVIVVEIYKYKLYWSTSRRHSVRLANFKDFISYFVML